MTDLTLVPDNLLSSQLVRKDEFILPNDTLQSISDKIRNIEQKLDGKQTVTDPIDWKDIKNKRFAWNELPGVSYATKPIYGIVQMGHDISEPIRQEDHYVAASCYAVSTVSTNTEGIVPVTRTINGHPLSEDVWVTPEDVGSYPKEYMMDALKGIDATYSLYVPDSTTVNGYPLSKDIWLTSYEVGIMTREDWRRLYNERLQAMWDQGGLLAWSGLRNYDINVFEPIGVTSSEYRASPRGIQLVPKGAVGYASEVLADNTTDLVVSYQITGSPNTSEYYTSWNKIAFSNIVPVQTDPWKESLNMLRNTIDTWATFVQSDDLLDMSTFHINGVPLASMYADTPLGSNRSIGIGYNGRFYWRIPNNENYILQIGGMNTKSAGTYLQNNSAANLIDLSTGTQNDLYCDVKMVNGRATFTNGYVALQVLIRTKTTVSFFGRNIS